ncbi:MAG TPA: hypothetical protein VEB86_18350 [Chryseosolibacter sp.]|nr:hypothetical protein [Chryseosolibacter sp.]
MKTLIKIIFLGVLTVLLSIAAMAKEPPKRSEPTGSKNKNFIVYKASKKLVGGRVEILQSNGDRVAEQTLQKRKLYMDCEHMKAGAYIVRITKGDLLQEFTFEKK